MMILVSGATGNVGRHLVRELAAAGHKVRALTRDPSRTFPDSVQVRVAHGGDPSSLPAVLEGVDRAFVMVNMPGDPQQGTNWAAALAESDVERVVLMSSLTLQNAAAADPISAIHKANEAAITQTRIPAAFVRPGIFMANARTWAEPVKGGGVVHIWPGDHPVAPVHEADIAAVAAHALTHDDVPSVLPVTGPETLTPSHQVKVLAEELGRELGVEELPAEVATGLLAAMVDEGADMLLDSMAGPDAPWRRPVGTVQQLLGRPGRTWRSWCTEHVADFR